MCALRGQHIAFLRFLLHTTTTTTTTTTIATATTTNNNNNDNININNNNKQLCKDLPSTNKDQEESESS